MLFERATAFENRRAPSLGTDERLGRVAEQTATTASPFPAPAPRGHGRARHHAPGRCSSAPAHDAPTPHRAHHVHERASTLLSTVSGPRHRSQPLPKIEPARAYASATFMFSLADNNVNNPSGVMFGDDLAAFTITARGGHLADIPNHRREDFSWPPPRTLTWPWKSDDSPTSSSER
jgi:hypothetical protein